MADKKDKRHAPNKHNEVEELQTEHVNTGPGTGSVTGIGGAGGSSGAGGVRVKPKNIGELSGIEREGANPPPPGSVRQHPSSRTAPNKDGGLPGKTNGPDRETIPNQTDDPGNPS